jgi:hypothetical protein
VVEIVLAAVMAEAGRHRRHADRLQVGGQAAAEFGGGGAAAEQQGSAADLGEAP